MILGYNWDSMYYISNNNTLFKEKRTIYVVLF